MVVCQYFLRGQCKFGDNCRNEHPRQGGTFGNPSWSNTNRNTERQMLPFTIDSLTKDLTVGVDKPAWPLSTYGPAKNEPNLLGGLDESPEELRVRATTALRAGSANEYMKYEAGKISAAEAVYNNARTNLQQAFEVASKQSSHAHLYAAGPSTAPSSSFNRPSPFAPSSSTTSAFGDTKPAFGQPTFGQTGFGTTTTATTSPFGQPPTTTGAFGQPIAQPTSAFGGSAFGQTSQPQSNVIKPGTGAFSNLGSGGTGGDGFSAFAGQPSPFGLGAPVPTTNPATNTTTTGGATFGQPSLGATSAFGALAQQQAQPAPAGFGTFGQQPQAGGNMAQPALAPVAPLSAFGQQAQPFGAANTQPQPSAFSAFSASTSSSTTTTSGFGQPAQSGSGLFGRTSSSLFSSTTTKAKKPHSGPPNFDAIIQVGTQFLASGTGANTLAYKPGSCPYDANLPPTYAEIIPKGFLEAFKSTRFEWGNVPECVPPVQLR